MKKINLPPSYLSGVDDYLFKREKILIGQHDGSLMNEARGELLELLGQAYTSGQIDALRDIGNKAKFFHRNKNQTVDAEEVFEKLHQIEKLK